MSHLGIYFALNSAMNETTAEQTSQMSFSQLNKGATSLLFSTEGQI